jgi:hypothetical protein
VIADFSGGDTDHERTQSEGYHNRWEIDGSPPPELPSMDSPA